jgi:hypothetical protein
MSDTPTQRYVPGAPPPVPASKTSKKKRKTGKGTTRSEDSPALSSVAIPDSTTPIEKTQDASDVKDGPPVDSLPVEPHGTNGLSSGQHAHDEAKHIPISPIVDLFQKRIKSTNKKIVRLFLWITAYKKGTAADPQLLYRLEYKAMLHSKKKN